MPEICFLKLSEKAILPSYGSDFAAGLDLSSVENVVVPARGTAKVDTGLQVRLPPGVYGRVAPRSGLAAKKSIDVGAGVIDPDYTGSIKVILFNLSDEKLEIKQGDRIAQLVCEKFERCQVRELSEKEKPEETERGKRGFGSTGIGSELNEKSKEPKLVK